MEDVMKRLMIANKLAAAGKEGLHQQGLSIPIT
jgi:hypothetical protein